MRLGGDHSTDDALIVRGRTEASSSGLGTERVASRSRSAAFEDAPSQNDVSLAVAN